MLSRKWSGRERERERVCMLDDLVWLGDEYFPI